MKKIAFLVLSLIPLIATAQEHNFSLTDAFLATPAKIIEYNFDNILSNLCKKDDDEW